MIDWICKSKDSGAGVDSTDPYHTAHLGDRGMTKHTTNLNRATVKEASTNIEAIRRHLSYDAKTGRITWVKPTSNRRKAGDEAGVSIHRGYRSVCFGYTSFLAHRLAWALHYGSWPAGIIDHINGDTSDNRIENLRATTFRTNSSNQQRHRNGSSCGVYQTSWGRWEARYKANGKRVYVGCFDTEGEAVRARADALSSSGLL